MATKNWRKLISGNITIATELLGRYQKTLEVIRKVDASPGIADPQIKINGEIIGATAGDVRTVLVNKLRRVAVELSNIGVHVDVKADEESGRQQEAKADDAVLAEASGDVGADTGRSSTGDRGVGADAASIPG